MAPALRLGLLLGLLGLLADPGSTTKVLHSLHYLDVAVSEPSPGVPQFMSIGFVDGIPFTRYDSERGRAEPLTQWIKDGVEPGYWDGQTQIWERNQHVAARDLETARERYNQSGVLHSLHYLDVAVSEPSPGVPQYMEIGFVDGIPFTRYDSERGRAEPLTQWIKDGAEPGYWDRQTQIGVESQHVDARNLETLRERYNQSGGLHTRLHVYGCDLLSDGTVHGSYKDGYDGRDFISFDLGSGGFVAADSAAEITRRRWEQEEEAERWTNYLKHVCPEWLRKYVGYGQKELERKEPPDVHVSGKEEHGTLILSCHAYGFYPNTIAVSWMKENTGMLEPGIFAWEPKSGSILTVAVAVSIIAAILAVLIAVGVWKLQSGKRDRSGYNVAAGKDVGINGSAAGITA
uniref:class I histocompatibility antigen, F10 alpha chain n=1 Tax=Lonchura striata TaxID=40157 RepID=UPI000B4D345A|nr:class I histocompatibility antigen, F10 alpha chain [Lonchura striata domestica]